MSVCCYVCLDDDPRSLIASPCDCVGRFLHVHCQRKMIRECHRSGRCGVCLAPFRNVDRRGRPTRMLALFVLAGATWFVSIWSICHVAVQVGLTLHAMLSLLVNLHFLKRSVGHLQDLWNSDEPFWIRTVRD